MRNIEINWYRKNKSCVHELFSHTNLKIGKARINEFTVSQFSYGVSV